MEAPKQRILDEFLIVITRDELHYLHDPTLDEKGGLDQLQNQVRKHQLYQFLRILRNDEFHCIGIPKSLPEYFLKIIGYSVLVLGYHVDVPTSGRVEVS